MKYRKLGTSNEDISLISLGTMTFGEQTSKKEAFKIMDYAFKKGINYFDTAEMYPVFPKRSTYGLTEKIIGSWLKKSNNRHKILIGTKVASCHPSGIGSTKLPWIRAGGDKLKFDKKNLFLAVENSLRRMNLEYIDILQLHWPERNVPIFGKLDFEYDQNDNKWTPIEEVLSNLDTLKKEGKIRYFGLSNETPWGIMKYINSAKNNSLISPVAVQNGYNLLNRVFDISHSEVSLREKCGLLAYSPLASGRLTGKYFKKKREKNSRFDLWPTRFARHFTKRGEIATKKYISLAKEYNLKPNLLAHSFVLSRPYLTSSIFGVTKLEQLIENIKSVEIILSKNILTKIQKIHTSDPNPCV